MANAPKPDVIDDSSAPLMEHLAELRNRIIKSLLAFVVAMLLCFTIWNPIFNFLTRPLCDALIARGQQCGLVLIQLQEGFFVAINISMIAGLALSFPVIAYQMWRFVAPGLYRSEKNAFLPFLAASPIMFFLGAAFAYYVATPFAFAFFLEFQQAGMMPSAGATPEQAGIAFQGSVKEFLSLTMAFILAFGLCFQLPVLLTLMGKAGLVQAVSLRNGRRWAIVGIMALAAFATPPDIITQIILFTVVYSLYEISIFLVARIESKRAEEFEEEFGVDLDADDSNSGAKS